MRDDSSTAFRVLAVALVLAFVVALIVVVSWDRRVAANVAVEDRVLEWLQVVLCVGTGLLALEARRVLQEAGRPAGLETVTAVVLAGVIVGEVDLDKRVFGVKLIATQFFVRSDVPLVWRAPAFLLVVGPPVALAIYAWRQRAQLWRALWALPHEAWGQLFMAAVVVDGIAAIFERQLTYVLPWPAYYLEETLELVGAILWFIALWARCQALLDETPP